MADISKIGMIVANKEFVNGHLHLTLKMLNSTMSMPSTNELPIILNTLKATDLLDKDVQRGFTYTFPFALSQGFGFPYLLDMQFEDKEMLTLA